MLCFVFQANADKWEANFGLLEQFVRENGNANVPQGHEVGGVKLGRWVINRNPGKVVLAGTRFFDRRPPKKEVRCTSTIGIVREVPYVNRPPSSTAVDDGDHDFHARTRG